MLNPYIGQITMFAGIFAPRDWAFCNGQLLHISQNPALFAIIGNQFGGDGHTTFALPDLRARFPMHPDNRQYVQSDIGGSDYYHLREDQMPEHTHPLHAFDAIADLTTPENAGLSTTQSRYAANVYTQNLFAAVPMAASSIGTAGRAASVCNLPPYMCINYVIAINGSFPPRP